MRYIIEDIDTGAFRAFKSRCAIEGITMRAVLIKFIENYGDPNARLQSARLDRKPRQLAAEIARAHAAAQEAK